MTRDELLAAGLEHHRAGRLEAAAAAYGAVLAENPDDAEGLNLFGVLAAQQRDFAKAVTLLSRAVQLAPNVAMHRSNLGAALRDFGRPQEALPHIDRALALQPGYWDALVHRGNSLRDLGEAGPAAQAYGEALAIAADPDVLAKRTEMLAKAGDQEAAAREAARLLDLTPAAQVRWGP